MKSIRSSLGHRLLSALIVTASLGSLTGCSKGSAEAKTDEEKKAFKGSKPPPEVQKMIDETMKKNAAKGAQGGSPR